MSPGKLPLPPEREGRARVLPLPSALHAEGGRGFALPAGTLLLKASFLFAHLFCLPELGKLLGPAVLWQGWGLGAGLPPDELSNNLHLAPLLAGTLPHLVPLQVTGRRLWKNVYDELGGSPGSTSAATCTRRHYERCGWGGSRTAPPSQGVVQEWGGLRIYYGQGWARMSTGVWGMHPAVQGSPGGQPSCRPPGQAGRGSSGCLHCPQKSARL